MLYIPANHPHCGYALEASLNYSIGFRAPSQQDLFSCLTDILLDTDDGHKRYQDPASLPCDEPLALSADMLSHCRQLLLEKLDDGLLAKTLGRLASEPKYPDLITLPNQPFKARELSQIPDHLWLEKAPYTRLYYHHIKDDRYWLFCNAEQLDVKQEQLRFALSLVKRPRLSIKIVKTYLQSLENRELLAMLLNMGAWHINE